MRCVRALQIQRLEGSRPGELWGLYVDEPVRGHARTMGTQRCPMATYRTNLAETPTCPSSRKVSGTVNGRGTDSLAGQLSATQAGEYGSAFDDKSYEWWR